MSQHESCSYEGRQEDLVGYVYRELTDEDHTRFETHLQACETCRTELAALEAVRLPLAEWMPPEPARALTLAAVSPVESRWPRWATLPDIPAWAQVAAAVLLLGVAAGVANLDIRYNEQGLSVRTGWAHQPARSNESAAQEQAWRAEFARLESELRDQLAAVPAAAPATQVSAEVIPSVRALLEDSERKQRRELALRVAQVMQDVEAQRRADHEQIEFNLGVVGATVQDLNDYMIRVSQGR